MASIGNISKLPELRKRLLFTFFCLAVCRLGVFITTPGVNRLEMQNLIQSNAGSFLGLFNMFTGGALEQGSIFALGIMPYITSSIIFQLLTVVVPTLERLSKEGEQGRKKINQWTRYGTIVLSSIQGLFIANMLEGMGRGGMLGFTGAEVVANPGLLFKFVTIISLTTGSVFLMWIGEQITERGIGNGISLVIFVGIVSDLPVALTQLNTVRSSGQITNFVLLLLGVIIVGVIAGVCFFERAHRRIPIQYAKRLVGRKMYGGQSTHLPLKINTAGVIPPIFASSLLMFPTQIAQMTGVEWMQQFANAMQMSDWRYNLVFVALVVFFCYFYTAISFNPVDVADNLKKNGGFIPGVRPGKKTAEYIDRVLTRITFAGAAYISAICVLPSILNTKLKVPFYFGGTGLLIVVGVALDFVQQVESHLISRHYEGFTGPKGPRIRGRTTARARG